MKIIKLLILSVLLLSTNLLASSVATITAIKGKATIQRDTNSINAVLGTKLEARDNIKTGDNSKLQIIFKDETVITIGKNSNFSIKEYLYEDSKEPVARFGIIKGAMKSITGQIGKIAPQKFSVVTKTAIIGIRGTNFTVVVAEDGSFQAYCTYGAISVIVDGKEHIIKQSYFLSGLLDGKTEIKEFSSEDLKKMRSKNFGVKSDKNSKYQSSRENDEQLDVTVNDESGIIISDVSDRARDISNAGDIEVVTKSLLENLSSYFMSNALYTGTYTTVGGASTLGAGGAAELAIDFNTDAISLTLDGGTAVYNDNPSLNGENFSVDIPVGSASGNATGTFQGQTGNSVTGSFDFNDGNSDVGTYDVSSSQDLY